MAYYLISSCNTEPFTSKFSLSVFDSNEHELYWVNIPEDAIPTQTFSGLTGILCLSESILVGVQGNPSRIILLNLDLSFQRLITFDKDYDIHSMCEYKSEVYIAATKTNQVLKLDLATDKLEPFWSYSKNSTEDALHLNVIHFRHDELLLLMHHNFKTSPVSGKLDGCLFNIKQDKVLLSGMAHPHTIYDDGDEIYVLDSFNGKVYKSAGTADFEIVYELDGFIRGMSGDKSEKVIGVSAQRLFSRKKGRKYKYFDIDSEYFGERKFCSFLAIITQDNIREVEFTSMNFEIYDIKRIELGGIDTLLKNPLTLKTQSYRKRISELQEICHDHKRNIQNLQRQPNSVKKWIKHILGMK